MLAQITLPAKWSYAPVTVKFVSYAPVASRPKLNPRKRKLRALKRNLRALKPNLKALKMTARGS